MAHDVFISYALEDKATAGAVCAKLEANKARCWIAPRDISPGVNWPAAIVEAIGKSKAMVLVYSSNANASEQVQREVQVAADHGVIIIPLRIEDVPPNDFMQFHMANRHWLDALTPPVEAHLQRLTDTVLRILQPASARQARQAADTNSEYLTDSPKGTPLIPDPGCTERAVRYCTTEDGVRIAYCVEGEGTPVLICPGFVESFTVDHLEPGQATFIGLISAGRQTIRFDMRGTGLSQRTDVDLSPAALQKDLDAVLKAARISQCFIWASTLAGPRAVEYAADHPRRVSGLILFGTYSRAADVMPPEAIRGMATFVRTSPEFAVSAIVGRSSIVGDHATSAAAALRQAEAYKQSADFGMVADLLIAGAETDASASLPRVRCPVLVLHRTEDTVIPFSAGQALAAGLQRAIFVPLKGDAHSFVFGDQLPIVKAIDEFLPR